MGILIRPITRKSLLNLRQFQYSQPKIHNLHHSTTPSHYYANKQTSTTAKSSFTLQNSTRTYISEMRNAAFEDNVVRLIRSEIQYELDHSPPTQPVVKFGAFDIDDRPGEQWIKLTRKFGENEYVKVEATIFDGAAPVSGTKGGIGEEMELHISFVVNISKGKDGDVFEILCSAWPDTIEINRLFVRKCDKMPAQPYMGPEFKEMEDELQNSLYEFLERRGIDDDFAVFLHQYTKNKDKIEYIRWLDTMKTFIERT